MTPTSPDFLLQLAMILVTGGAVYGGVKSDLRSMRKDIERQGRAIGKAHERIDAILEK